MTIHRSAAALTVSGALALASLPACGVVFVDSPSSRGLGCTDSKFMPYMDYLIAIGLTAAMIGYGTVSDAPAALSVPAVFALSGLWGSHKVNQCRERLATATPQDWDNYARWSHDQEQRDAEERARQRQSLDQQVQQQSNGAAPDNRGASNPPPVTSGSITLTINGTTYTDRANGELGKPCGINNNTCTSPAYSCVLVTSTSGMCAPTR